jgi:hypothetical protein
MTRPGLTIFALFFGLATIEAITDGRWPRIAFWLLMAAAFVLLDRWVVTSPSRDHSIKTREARRIARAAHHTGSRLF